MEFCYKFTSLWQHCLDKNMHKKTKDHFMFLITDRDQLRVMAMQCFEIVALPILQAQKYMKKVTQQNKTVMTTFT